MDIETIEIINELNPWLESKDFASLKRINYVNRDQLGKLKLKEWDDFCLVITGPRQAGKTTLGKYLSKVLIEKKAFNELLYLSCDFYEIRQLLKLPTFVKESIKEFDLKKPIIFIDEVQRLENPGLLLKGIIDLNLPIKLIASGSSQLEIKSTVQEYLTGRHIEFIVLPLSFKEIGSVKQENIIYGCYPKVHTSKQKEIILKQLFQDYISKDIIEILKVSKPDIMQKLITLIAHSSGQLVNYNQLSIDCKTSVSTVTNYLSILERTYTIAKVLPFVGNKRKEIVSNPIYYFIDNGFRNQALRRFTKSLDKDDIGFLIESSVFQEILKYKDQNFYDFDIHFWRTQSKAEVDFVLYKTDDLFLPIEVKFQNMKKTSLTKSMHSFIEAYMPKDAIVITKNFQDKIKLKNCNIYFIPFQKLFDIFSIINKALKL